MNIPPEADLYRQLHKRLRLKGFGMRFLKYRPVLIIILALVIVSMILILIGTFFDYTYYQDFFSNGISTLVGVIIGIPVALYVNRLQESATEKERKKKILTLLSKELGSNQEILKQWHFSNEDLTTGNIAVEDLSIFLGDEVWRAFSDGGELQWIKDPDILRRLAYTYFLIETMKKRSERFFVLITSRGIRLPIYRIPRFTDFNPDIIKLLGQIDDEINNLISEINGNIDYIKGELK